MSRMFALIAAMAIFALMAVGCSGTDSPTAPSNISAIVFPVDAGDSEGESITPLPPTDLRASRSGNKVKLAWRHVDLAEGWFRIYVAKDGGDFEMIRCTDCFRCEACIGCAWTKLEYRVSAVNSLGVESELSDPVIFKRDFVEMPNVAVYEDDDWN